MIQNAVVAFVGAFSALLVLAEVQMPSKWLRYLVAFVVGIVVAILLSMLVHYVAGLFGRAA